MDRAPSARDSNWPAIIVEREGRAKGGATSGGKLRLDDNSSQQLGPVHRGLGYEPAAFSCFALIYDDLCQPIPAPGFVAIGTAVANSSQCAVPK